MAIICSLMKNSLGEVVEFLFVNKQREISQRITKGESAFSPTEEK